MMILINKWQCTYTELIALLSTQSLATLLLDMESSATEPAILTQEGEFL